jgi:alpha-D-ribose 1-methylphosphonate 5-triphosphate synthase subunit PhnG
VPGTDAARSRWMSALAQADPAAVEAAWAGLEARPAYRLLRAPETGLVMVQGRAGGTGAPFNLGEMTVTRCSVELGDGRVGHAYVAGRDSRHAETAAVLDAMLQDPTGRAALETAVVEPLVAAREARQRAAQARADATRVEFFTMVRGEE